MGKSIRNLTSVTRVGLDLAKNVFQVHARRREGRRSIVARKLQARPAASSFFAALPRCVVGDGGVQLRRTIGGGR